jgi:hypothetical protein
MNIRSWAPALALAILALTFAGRADAILYDLDFGTPPHTVGLPPVTGAGPAVRETVSAINNGTPLVVAAAGALVDQPCFFSSYDGQGDQIQLDLWDLPLSSNYTLDVDVLVIGGEPQAELAFNFDTPDVRTVRFLGDGTVMGFVPGVGDLLLGAYVPGQVVRLSVEVVLDADFWTISLDGAEVYAGSFGGATELEDVRVSTAVDPNPLRLRGAIDNLVLSEGPGLADGGCDRLGFGDLVRGAVYNVGDSFATDSVTVNVEPFATDVGACGAPFASGFTEVVVGGLACGSGKELEVNNVSLAFDFGATVTDVVIPFGEYGGTVSLEVNGDCEVVENFIELDGTNLGGVAVSVWDPNVPGQGCGVIRLGGQVASLAIGGQELFLDDLSYCISCPDLQRSAFEDQTLNATFNVGDSFTSGAATHTFFAFFPPGPDCVNPDPNGVATIGNGRNACGDGKELQLNNINDRIDFGAPLQWLALNYGEYGGNVNIRINGDCRNLDNLSDVNGSMVGGVTVWAIDYGPAGQSCGNLYAVGTIDNFRIGGQEFFIDNVRACPISTAAVIGPREDAAPSPLRLDPSWPNPARGNATLRFALAAPADIRMTIFDVGGRAVRALIDGAMDAGDHEVRWDGKDDRGNRLPAGVYSYRIQSGGSSVARRLVLLP